MTSSIVRCCCGVACAACWFVIGIWAFFFLGILALLFYMNKQGNIGDYDPDDHKKYGKTLLITWIIYIVVTILCGINLFYRLKHPWPAEGQEDDRKKNEFTPAESLEQNLTDEEHA